MTPIRKMLFATKFQELTFNALEALLDLKAVGLDHVVFLYVVERDKVAFHRGTGYQKSEEVKLKEVANIHFIDWAEYLFEQGMEVGVHIVVGTLVQQVSRAAGVEKVDLIVIGRPTRGRLEQLVSGADISDLIRRTQVPILVYKQEDRPEPAEKTHLFTRPLIATDWSPAAGKAMDYLMGLKDIVEEINVIHVGKEKALKSLSAMDVQSYRKSCREKLRAICDRFESAGIKARSHLYVGDPFQEIEIAAREWRASMIVTGCSGKGTWRERIIGSVPRFLAEKSDISSLIVPLGEKS
ncbi:MAG: universal stress protein [Desulfobacterales bacterium]|jgi:nucleotide-binding universal stress UspA family protein